MQLEAVRVEGFRSIQELPELLVGSPVLLTGHNDAGKSAFIDAVRFLLGDYELTERDPTLVPGSAGAADPAQRVSEVAVVGTFSLNDEERGSHDRDQTVLLRRRSFAGAAALYEVFENVPDDENLQDLEAQGLSELKKRVKALGLTPGGSNKPDLLQALRDVAKEAPATGGWQTASSRLVKALPRVMRFNPSGIADAEQTIRGALTASYRVHESSDELVGSLRELELQLEAKVTADAENLREHITKTIPDLGSVTIIPSVSFSSGLKHTQVSVTNPAGEAIHLGEAGAGRARRVSLAVWEFTTGLLDESSDVVILYDEPDTHLDYAHQRNFMTLLQRQTELAHVRMIVATHSMNLIDGTDISNVVLFSHDQQFRTTARTLIDDSEVGAHLGAVAASLGLRNTVLLHERLFVGVEGATEAAAFPVLFRLATGRQLEACGIALWSCDNNEGALKFARYLNSHGRDVAFLVDQDSKKQSKHLFSTKKLSEYGLTEAHHAIYIGNPNELEDLFDDDTWVRVANEHWPKVDGNLWTANELTPLREEKFSAQLLSLFKTGSDTGPKNKQELVTTLSLSLKEKDQVPESLTLAFGLLVERARI